ncbi:large ribosomal subunit protein bL19cy-like [Euphorbia lathyris]|uniref:large ribosomal subunit protein bL19cy-like n=1 Tax=Euphorbia lathyris TaxID=212925 RepID=UPI003313CE9C
MGSKILPQALVIIPRKPTQCVAPRNFGFSATVNRGSSLFNSSHRVSVNRGLSNSSNLDAVISAFSRQRFVAGAESEGSAGGEVAEESVDVEQETEELGEGAVSEDGEVKAEVKEPRKPIVKLGDIMGILNKRAIEASDKERPIPDIRTGDVLQIKLEVPENRRRLSIYKGIVISRQNAGIHSTIRVRRIIAGIGVEIVFPLYSPNIKEIKVVKHRKVRRARLYYLRDKLPRLSTFK